MSSNAKKILSEILTEEEVDALRQDEGAYKEALKFCSTENFKSVQIIKIKNKRFVISNKDVFNLPIGWGNTLEMLVENEELQNPIYVTLGEDGALLVD